MPKEDASVDYYAVLGIPSTATADEIRKQFKKLALQYHPDRNVGKEAEFNTKFQAIQAAHELLSDPTRRRVYDRSRAVYRATTSSATSSYSNYRSSPSTQPRGGQPNGTASAFYAKAQAAREQAAREQAARTAREHAEAEARRRQGQASGWTYGQSSRKPPTEGWHYSQARNRREEVPRTPKKTRDNPYDTDEYATRGARTDPRKEASGFFANRNPCEREWMHAEGSYNSSGSNSGRKFAAEARAAEQASHSAPRPASTSTYSYTPKERVRINPYEGAPKPQRSNDDFSASSRGSPRMRSHAARSSPTQATAPPNVNGRRKSSIGRVGSELNGGSGFSYLFNNREGPRGPARSARHPRPPEVEEDDDDSEDDFFTKLNNTRKASFPNSSSARRQGSLGEEQLRGRTGGEQLRQQAAQQAQQQAAHQHAQQQQQQQEQRLPRTPKARAHDWRDAPSPEQGSSSDDERESSVSPTPTKSKVDPISMRPKARMRRPRVEEVDDISSDEESRPPERKQTRGFGGNFGGNFKFDMSSSQESISNSAADNEPPSPPASHSNNTAPSFDFTAFTNQPPDSKSATNSAEGVSSTFNPQAWKDMFSFSSGQSNLFEPSQSPRKMPANNRMHSSFDTQGPVNFSRPRPSSMAPPPDVEEPEEDPRFSSPEPEEGSKPSESQDTNHTQDTPPSSQSKSQTQAHPQQQPTPPTTSTFAFQASEWEQTFSNLNPFELRTKMAPGLGSANNSRPASRNRRPGGANKKVPVSVFPVPQQKPAPEPSPKKENEKPANIFSAFSFPKTPSMQNKMGNGTGLSTPSDAGLGGGASGVSGAPSPMAMDLDTPSTSPLSTNKTTPPNENGTTASGTAPGSDSAQGTTQGPATAAQTSTEGNPFEPNLSSHRTRSKSPKKAHHHHHHHHKSAASHPKPNNSVPRASTPPPTKSAKVASSASSSNTLPRPKTNNSPKKARTKLSLDDLGAVPPFAAPPPSSDGINGQWTDFADNLPFASKAAPHINLSPPASPKREARTIPPAPVAPGPFTELSLDAYRKYSNQIQIYQTHWNQWNEDITGHFKARLELDVMACAKNQGLIGGAFVGGFDGLETDLKSIDQALQDYEDDRSIRATWDAACKRHGFCLNSWKDYLQALKSEAP